MSRMAPANSSRQLWMWSLPSLVVLLSFVWYKRKRNTLRSDPGGTLKDLPETTEAKLQGLEDKEESSLPQSESVNERDSASSPCVHANIVAVKNSGETEFSSKISEPLQTSEVILDKSTLRCSSESAESAGAIDEEVICKQVAVLNCEKGPKTELQDIVEVAKEAILSYTEGKEVRVENLEASASMNCETEAISTSGKMKDTKDAVEVPVACPITAKDSDDKVASLEGKLASLALGSSEEQRLGAERDSANHSPVDAMLASPSMSSYSDEHSEGSSDSGKGCSDVASPPSRTPVGSGSLAGDAEVDTGVDSTSSYSVYDFLLPQQFVGRLIGRHGTFVHDIKSKTNATIWIKKHPETSKHKICSVEGTATDIDNALALIRERFPPRKYPNVTLEQVSLVPTTFPLVPDFCQLHLVEGVNNEVMISSLVTPAHMFVQQPYHPSYQYLQRLNHMMNSVYAQLETPNLPDPIEAGNICVAPAIDGWYRAQVVSSNEESQSSEIKFVDYGGYMTVNNPVLRQIRQDFMTLPFQATECYLANIKPTGESGEWSLDALRIVEELTRGQMLLAQVYDYAADGVPLIYLYSSINSQPWMYDPEVVLINQELVARGMADLDDSVISSPTSEAASLVVAAKAMAVAAAAGDTTSATSTTDSPTSNSTANSAENVKTVESSSSEEASN